MKISDKKALERFRKLVKQINESTQLNPFESEQDKTERISKAKLDYAFFVRSYFPHYASADCADFQLDMAKKVRKDKHIKLLYACGRGLAKSTHMNILLPLWLWINGDLKVMVLIGQNEEKGRVLLADIQAEFEANQLLINDFGGQHNQGSWEEGRFVTKNDCAFFALGMGQSPRGLRHRQYRPDYIVGDDLDTKEVCRNPKRVRQYANWVCEDLIPSMDERGGRYIQVNNIFAPETILTHIRDTRKGFKFIQVNATDNFGNPTWSSKYSKTYYDTLRNQIGELSFQSEFNNSPYAEGTLFTQEMIVYTPAPPPHRYQMLVGFWDVAYSGSKTADFNAVKVWGLKDGVFYLVASFVQQCKMAQAVDFIYQYTAQLSEGGKAKIKWYYESQFWDEALAMVLHEGALKYPEIKPNIIKSAKPKGNKYDRILTLLPYYQQSKIRYSQALKDDPNTQTGLAQLFGIEPGYKGHDDSPDADAQALDILAKYVHKTKAQYSIGQRASRKY